jgi:diacylglycerol kinase
MTDHPPYRSPNRWLSFRYALEGWGYLLRTQPNARIHTLGALSVISLGLWLGVSATDWAILSITIGLVFMAEFFNSAVEAVIDLISPEIHPLAKAAKDTAAGAVLCIACVAVVIGLLVLGPPLWNRVLSLIVPVVP